MRLGIDRGKKDSDRESNKQAESSREMRDRDRQTEMRGQ